MPTTADERILTEVPPPFPVRRPEVIEAITRMLESDDWTRLEGSPEAEAALREFHGGGTVWYVSSGTAALQACMLGHEIGAGDEVITTPLTWGATTSSILTLGAIPVFADIDRYHGQLDPSTVEALITPRTKAILAVHLYGHACDVVALREIADRHGLVLIEDGSQAHGARLHGKRVGRFGHASAFSCMGYKLLAGTEGGYAVFENHEAAERAYLYGKHPRGLAPEQAQRLTADGLLDALQFGWRPCAVGAELIRLQLPYLDEECDARRRNAQHLRELLADVDGLTMPEEIPGGDAAYHLLSLVYEPEVAGVSREVFRERLGAYGVGGFEYIPVPLHRLRRMNWADYEGPRVLWHDWLRAAGMDYRKISCPNAEWRTARSLEWAFNWTQDNPRAMEQLGTALRKATGQ